MIQFQNLSLTETTPSTSSSSNSSNNPSNLASFETALQDAIATTFEQFGIDPKSVNISITPQSSSSASSAGTSSATNSTPVTETTPYDPFLQAASSTTMPDTSVTPGAASAGSSSTTPAASGPATTSNTTATINTTTTSGTASDAAATDATDATDDQEAFDNAYWAQQPPAVQALRNMQPDERAAAARNLAAEGYTIDVPIMVWGWDPQIATQIRQAAGYTWVPSGLQNPIESMPGVAPLSGLTAYNPNQPPAGSILV
ncbi:MAG TPA: hypothetical protein VMB25_15030 [Bryobacteraceae bacterium]|nr:hypothetical protein [Bryobacteraceae bacterium]